MITNSSQEEAFCYESFIIAWGDDDTRAKVYCRWTSCGTTPKNRSEPYLHTLDLKLNLWPLLEGNEKEKDEGSIQDAVGTALETVVRSLGATLRDGLEGTEISIKIILAPRAGYPCRSDLLDLRLLHCEYVEQIVSFAAWDTYLPPLPIEHRPTLLQILASSVGALVLKPSSLLSKEKAEEALQKELNMRLSFDWVLSTKPVARRVAVIGGRYKYDREGGMYGSQGFFEAAQALGVFLIVFDNPGHWLESDEYAHLRDEFIPVDMSNQAELPETIVEAIRSRRIDGVVTFTDDYVLATAKAAEMLGFPTESVEAMMVGHTKHEMRRLINETNVEAMHVDSTKQLHDASVTKKLRTLNYPLIVKPSRGQHSKGVKKVVDYAGLHQAVMSLEENGLAQQGILIETYVDGPEIDANFVLWNGQILFLEVTDNFPCSADAKGATLTEDFIETVQISNSRLPPEEIESIRTSLHQSLLRLGFKSGVFHVEARVQNSSMRYDISKEAGLLDLVPLDNRGKSSSVSSHKPSAFLIEVNARPPGTGGTWSSLFTYGVDMGALHLLRALDDRDRFEKLSHPFLFHNTGGGGGAQYWHAHCMIPIHRENVLVPHDLFERIYAVLPKLVGYVSRAEFYAQPGTIVSPHKGTPWIAVILLFSRTSRSHVLEMYNCFANVTRSILDEAIKYS